LLFDANLLRIVRRVTPSENDYGFVEFGAEGKKLTTKNAPTETDLIPLCRVRSAASRVAGYAASLILGEHLGHVGVIRILARIDIQERLAIGVDQ
jgi:predicted LPLAT superfamily acyltransferase